MKREISKHLAAANKALNHFNDKMSFIEIELEEMENS